MKETVLEGSRLMEEEVADAELWVVGRLPGERQAQWFVAQLPAGAGHAGGPRRVADLGMRPSQRDQHRQLVLPAGLDAKRPLEVECRLGPDAKLPRSAAGCSR